MKRIRTVEPPQGLARLLYRMPIVFYRAGLGWMLGKRFVFLTHTGRRSGKTRQTVLEIIRRDIEGQTLYVVSAFGDKADWYQNILAQPEVNIQVSKKKAQAIAHPLPIEDAVQEMQRYYQAHPRLLTMLVRVVGYEIRNENDVQELSAHIPVVKLQIISK